MANSTDEVSCLGDIPLESTLSQSLTRLCKGERYNGFEIIDMGYSDDEINLLQSLNVDRAESEYIYIGDNVITPEEQIKDFLKYIGNKDDTSSQATRLISETLYNFKNAHEKIFNKTIDVELRSELSFGCEYNIDCNYFHVDGIKNSLGNHLEPITAFKLSVPLKGPSTVLYDAPECFAGTSDPESSDIDYRYTKSHELGKASLFTTSGYTATIHSQPIHTEGRILMLMSGEATDHCKKYTPEGYLMKRS